MGRKSIREQRDRESNDVQEAGGRKINLKKDKSEAEKEVNGGHGKER